MELAYVAVLSLFSATTALLVRHLVSGLGDSPANGVTSHATPNMWMWATWLVTVVLGVIGAGVMLLLAFRQRRRLHTAEASDAERTSPAPDRTSPWPPPHPEDRAS